MNVKYTLTTISSDSEKGRVFQSRHFYNRNIVVTARRVHSWTEQIMNVINKRFPNDIVAIIVY